MKKTLIVAAGVICLSVGFTNAEDVAVAFDGLGKTSVNAYITARADENKEAQKISEPQAVKESSREDAVNPYKNRLIVIKDLLKDLSSKDRVEFMSTIKLIDGRVASQGYAVLERNGMSNARIDEILLAFESSEAEVRLYTPVTERQMIKIGDLLRDVPEQAKEDFFDNMKFLNGGVASAGTELLEKAVAPGKLNEILDTFMPAMRMTSNKAKVITRAKDEACETWIHHDEKTIERNCNPTKKHSCNPSVCK